MNDSLATIFNEIETGLIDELTSQKTAITIVINASNSSSSAQMDLCIAQRFLCVNYHYYH